LEGLLGSSNSCGAGKRAGTRAGRWGGGGKGDMRKQRRQRCSRPQQAAAPCQAPLPHRPCQQIITMEVCAPLWGTL
jgi:hypothetical protein